MEKASAAPKFKSRRLWGKKKDFAPHAQTGRVSLGMYLRAFRLFLDGVEFVRVRACPKYDLAVVRVQARRISIREMIVTHLGLQ